MVLLYLITKLLLWVSFCIWEETTKCYYMACVHNQCNTHSDWLIIGHYTSMIPIGQLMACKRKSKSPIVNSLEQLVIKRKNFKLPIAWSIKQGLGLRFSFKDLTPN